MLFFIDETWQQTGDKKHKAGVLGAIPISSPVFNDLSVQVYNIKKKYLGFQAADLELKGHKLFQRYYFRLEQKGIKSDQLNIAREVFSLCDTFGVKTFASVTFEKSELDLACANADQLERPFFYLFERINQFMKENHPNLVAKLIFDDRGVPMNQRVSKAISNFFHKSQIGRSFDKILKVPFFAISSENIGIQMADLVGHIIGRRFTGDKNITVEFFKKVKAMQFESKELKGPEGQPVKGIKAIRVKGGAEISEEEV